MPFFFLLFLFIFVKTKKTLYVRNRSKTAFRLGLFSIIGIGNCRCQFHHWIVFQKRIYCKGQKNCTICLGSHTHSIGHRIYCLFCFSIGVSSIGSNERCGFATDFVGTSACQHYWYRLDYHGLVETQKTCRE